MERIAAADSPQAAKRTLERPVLLNGLDVVVATGRMKATVSAEQRAEKDLIQTYEADQDAARNFDEQQPQHAHERFSGSFLAIRSASERSETRILRKSGAAPRRGRMTMSRPRGNSLC